MPRPPINGRAMSSGERSARQRERETARMAMLEASLRDLLPDAEARLNHLEFQAGYRRSKAERAGFAAEAEAYRAKIERARAALGEGAGR